MTPCPPPQASSARLRQRDGRLAVRAGRVFDGERDVGPGAVVVDGGRITHVVADAAAGPGVVQTLGDDVTVLDLGDATLLPGLVEPHAHLCLDASADPVTSLLAADPAVVTARARSAAAEALRAGITTVRDLGDLDYRTLALSDDSSELLPEVLPAGPPLTSPRGHCWFLGGAVQGEAAVRAAVRERAERGCCVVKVMASGGHLTPGSDPTRMQLTSAELLAAVDEAHRCGLPVAAHAHGAEAVLAAAAAGVDTIEHATFYAEDGGVPDVADLERVVASGCVLGITLGAVPGGSPPPAPVLARLRSARAVWRQLHERGARLVIGTDAGVADTKPHDVLPLGLLAAQSLGLTPRQVLATATAEAATVCGVGGRKGRLLPGYDADLLAVGGNPLEDLRTLVDVRAVVRAGRRVR